MNIDKTQAKLSQLEELKASLKKDFLGLDRQIDQIVKTLTPWFIDPELLDRPVIINLWGITGTGKTEMVRKIVKYLKIDLFIDFDCRELNFHKTLQNVKTLSTLESAPVIFLFDEFQFTRSVDMNGKEVTKEGHEILWNFFNDGMISVQSESWTSRELDNRLLNDIFGDDKDKHPNGLGISERLIRELCTTLKLNLTELTTAITDSRGLDLFTTIRRLVQQSAEIGSRFNLRKSLIFVSGNVDEAFNGHFKEVDSDSLTANEFFEETSKVTVADIKKALFERFRAEQIARLGHNHIIFPSINEENYRLIIKKHLNKFQDRLKEKTEQKVYLEESLENFVFEYGVVVSQGTRNLLSFIAGTVESRIPELAYLINLHKLSNCVLSYSEFKLHLKALKDGKQFDWEDSIDGLTSRDQLHDDPAYQKLVAIHEAGHAIVGYILSGKPPELIRSKTSKSSTGGFVKLAKLSHVVTKKDYKDRISSTLSGYLAEKMIFGEDGVTAGCRGDIDNATKIASNMIREFGMGTHIASSSQSPYAPHATKSFKEQDETGIEAVLKECETVAQKTLDTHKDMHKALYTELLTKTKITSEEFIEIVKPFESPKEEKAVA